MTMIGFPPSIQDRWSLSNWQNAPYNRWSFSHLREVVPTARVGRGSAPAQRLPDGKGFDPSQVVWRLDGRSATVTEILDDTFTDGFLVLQDGRIVSEEYPANPHSGTALSPESTHMLMSVSKSFVGCVIGILADQGLLEVDTAVDNYVPELAYSGYRGATVRDVLDMRSGITFSEDYLDDAAEVRLLEQVIGWAPRFDPALPSSMYEYLASLQAGRPHGREFEYRSCETDILGWVAERASGIRMPDLLSSLIWSRIGAEQDMDAAVDPAGAIFHDGGLAATLRDLGRFGQLLLDGGVNGAGEQVIPTWWIADSYAAGPDSRDRFATSGNASWLPAGAYRNQFWLPGNRQVLLCLGIHGQLIWVEPARRLVVVKLSSWPLPQDLTRLLDTFAAIDMIGFQLSLG